MEKLHKPVSKLFQKPYVFIGSGTYFTGSSIIFMLVYGIFPIGIRNKISNKIDFTCLLSYIIYLFDIILFLNMNLSQSFTFKILRC